MDVITDLVVMIDGAARIQDYVCANPRHGIHDHAAANHRAWTDHGTVRDDSGWVASDGEGFGLVSQQGEDA
jgi:hypothetical protein